MVAARALREAAPTETVPHPLLVQSDARALELPEAAGGAAVDAILTSPPYAGVYDYLSHAREERAGLGARGEAPLMGLVGTPEGRSWPEPWRSTVEMGSRKSLRRAARKVGPGEFAREWAADQRAWLAAARAALRPGGCAAVLIGDGEGGIDALASTEEAAQAAGLRLLASATIAPSSEAGGRQKARPGRRRPEHALLFEG